MLDSPLKRPRPSYVVAVDELAQQGRFFLLCDESFEESKTRHHDVGGFRGAS